MTRGTTDRTTGYSASWPAIANICSGEEYRWAMAVDGIHETFDPPDDADLRRAIIPLLPRLRRFCMGLAGNRDDGDDLAQATIGRALAAERSFVPGTRLDSWLFRIAQNLHIDQRRRRATRGIEIDPDDITGYAGSDGREIAEVRSDLDHVRQRFERLPEEQRMVLTLVVVDGRSYQETADIIGVPTGTVMSRLCRARRALAHQIDPETAP